MNSARIRIRVQLAVKRFTGLRSSRIPAIASLSIINHAFKEPRSFGLLSRLTHAAALVGLVIAFFVVAQLLEKAGVEQRKRDGWKVFPGAMWLRGIYLVTISIGIAMMVGMYREGDRWWVVSMPVLLILLGYIPRPRAIKISHAEIRQGRPFRSALRIPVREMESASLDPGSGVVMVFGRNGTQLSTALTTSTARNLSKRLKS